MPTYREIDIHGVVDYAQLASSQQLRLATNTLTDQPIRGDQILLKFTLYQAEGATTPFAIPAGAGLELVITANYEATVESEVLCYADDTQFDPTLWADFDRTVGKVAVLLDTNTTNLLTELGTSANGTYHVALIMTPPGGS